MRGGVVDADGRRIGCVWEGKRMREAAQEFDCAKGQGRDGRHAAIKQGKTNRGGFGISLELVSVGWQSPQRDTDLASLSAWATPAETSRSWVTKAGRGRQAGRARHECRSGRFSPEGDGETEIIGQNI